VSDSSCRKPWTSWWNTTAERRDNLWALNTEQEYHEEKRDEQVLEENEAQERQPVPVA
jgi:hypothetical protein